MLERQCGCTSLKHMILFFYQLTYVKSAIPDKLFEEVGRPWAIELATGQTVLKRYPD